MIISIAGQENTIVINDEQDYENFIKSNAKQFLNLKSIPEADTLYTKYFNGETEINVIINGLIAGWKTVVGLNKVSYFINENFINYSTNFGEA